MTFEAMKPEKAYISYSISMFAMVEVIIAPSKDLFAPFTLSISRLISIIFFEDIGFDFGSTDFNNL